MQRLARGLGRAALFVVALAAACGDGGEERANGGVAADAGDGGPAPVRPRPRVLVVTHTAAFRHASIATAERVLREIAEGEAVDLGYARTGEDVKTMLTPSGLATYAGVVFANTSGNLGVVDLEGFLAWLAEGHAFLGVHAASDTYHDAPAYLAMLGGEFKTHGVPCEVAPRVEDAEHPAVAHLTSGFRVHDEIYELVASPRPGAHVLLSLDRHPPDGHPEAGAPGDFPLAWTRVHGHGRVFYTALGHGEEVWESAAFRQHLRGALRWALAAP